MREGGSLVTDGIWRKALAAVRGLGEARVPVAVGEVSRLNAAAFSRFARRRLRYPSPVSAPERFGAWLVETAGELRLSSILPMEDATLDLCLRIRAALPRGCGVPFPEPGVVGRLRDKARALELASSLGIPAPRTVPALGPEDPRLAALRPPFVVKPRVGSGSRGRRYVERRQDVPAAIRAIEARRGACVVQERVAPAGRAIGVGCVLGRDGGALAAVAYRRLRQYPVDGGPGTLRETIEHPEAIARSIALLRAAGWVGPAHCEFLEDPSTGEPLLLEVNPRFWGSLALAVRAGVNVPLLCHELARGVDPAPVRTYRVGVRCRFLFPGDALHFLRNPDRWRLDPPFFRFRGAHYDVESWRDPGPALGQFLSLVPFLTRAEFRAIRRG
ncbi:MAG TPA: ATP-grasp domain-containing protein [Planctomycetota bacterium]|jgi:predicted ATP-grasp superfamily ATP-dependent carboligase|nr:ATP-grasp domain-containing protein [Planctomycetota bacterium]